MDAPTALKQLQLDSLPPASELKRAYLKAVRLHPPERDPEGFQQVRAAFELLRELALTGLNSVDTGAESSAGPELSRHVETTLEVPHEGTQPSEASPNVEASAPPSVDWVEQRALTLLSSESYEPTEEEAVLEELSERGGPERSVLVLTRAAMSGSTRAQLRLLYEHPTELSPTIIALVGSSADLDLKRGLVACRLARGEADEAAGVMTQVLRGSESNGLTLYSISLCLNVVLHCIAQGFHRAGSALLEEFEAVQGSWADTKGLPVSLAAQWHLVRELHELRLHLTSEMREVLARAMLEGDREILARELKQSRHVLLASTLDDFATHAPAVYEWASPFLYRRTTTETNKSSASVWLLGPMIFSVLGLLGSLGGKHSSAPDLSHLTQPPIAMDASQGQGAGSAVAPNAPVRPSPTELPNDPAGLAEAAAKIGYIAYAHQTRQLWQLIQSGTCRVPSEQLDDFARSTDLVVRTKPELLPPSEVFMSYVTSACSSQLRGVAK